MYKEGICEQAEEKSKYPEKIKTKDESKSKSIPEKSLHAVREIKEITSTQTEGFRSF